MQRDVDTRELDEFISLLAHDLRTPLTSIRGYAQLMLRQRRTTPDDSARPAGEEDSIASGLRIIMEQSDRLAGLTDLLLDVSRIRLARVALRPGEVDLSAAARGISLTLPGVSLTVDGPERGPSVRGDAARVQQMVGAIVRYLATRGGSEAVNIRIGVDRGAAKLIAEGGGDALTADETARLLYELVRPAPNAAGWQLANPELFIARGVAEAHNGALSAESPIDATGRGVRLTLQLPVA